MHFVVCIHDASPAFAEETRLMMRDLAPLIGRRLSLGVVPDWHGGWPLSKHRGWCDEIRGETGEALLHGYSHRRARAHGAVSLLTGGADEMNGIDAAATRGLIERGQRAFSDAFGERAAGFLPPAWQRGHVVAGDQFEYVLGFFSLDTAAGDSIALATWSWDCGRFGWLGRVGDAAGSLLHASSRRVPVLALHPADVGRGYWPRVLRLTQHLLDEGYEPRTPSGLLQAMDAEVTV